MEISSAVTQCARSVAYPVTREFAMNREYFFAQDQAGNMQKVNVARHAPQSSRQPAAPDKPAAPSPRATYSLADGSPVKRIDSDTFLVLDTGAYVTVIRE